MLTKEEIELLELYKEQMLQIKSFAILVKTLMQRMMCGGDCYE